MTDLQCKCPLSLRSDIALAHILAIVIHKFGPIVSELRYRYLQPWFQVAIVMYDCCSFDILLRDIRIVTKSQYMPRFVQSISAIPKGYQTWWQCSQFPKESVVILTIESGTKSYIYKSHKEIQALCSDIAMIVQLVYTQTNDLLSQSSIKSNSHLPHSQCCKQQ